MIMTEIEGGAPAACIRKAERRDAPRLLEMVEALAAHHGDEASPTVHSLERDLFGPRACSQGLLAECDGTVVGYALLSCFPHLQWGRRVMDLNHLFVEAGHRGSGIGRQLVAAAVSEARRQECGQMVVSTHPENSKAQGLYLSLGFNEKPIGGKRFRLELPANGALPAGWI